jgi:ribosomal protein S18 acetylase RimI-like enzyme
MESLAEQEAYVQARNEAFSDQILTLKDWQYFMASKQWAAGTMLAAFEGENLTGCALAYWDEAQNQSSGQMIGFTEYIFVRPAWRHKRVARSLISAALQVLQKNNLSEARLEVLARNTHALALYTAQGYRSISESRLYGREI